MRKEKLEELQYYLNLLKVIEINKSKENPSFVSVSKYAITLNNGKKITREKILKNNLDGSAAIIIPVTPENEYLVSIEPRVFTKQTVDVGFPAGYIDENENSVDAAKRELKEETGYVVSDMIKLGSFYQDQGISSALNSYFLGLGAVKKYEQSLDEDELIKYMTFNEREIEYLINHGYMTGLNSAYIYEKTKNYLKERR